MSEKMNKMQPNTHLVAKTPIEIRHVVAVGEYEYTELDGGASFIANPKDGATQLPGGIAFLTPFTGGHQHRFTLKLRNGAAAIRFRVEVNGTVTRFQKAILRINLDAEILAQGEELYDIQVARDEKNVTVCFAFTPYRSTNEWVYVLAENAHGIPSTSFQVDALRLETFSTPKAHLRREHFSLVRTAGVEVACQQLTLFQGVISAQIEVHRPHTRLQTLRIESKAAVDHWKWWTWEPIPGPHSNMTGPPTQPDLPINSPALMDEYGSEFANKGHVITGIYSDYRDIQRLSNDEMIALYDLTLVADFEDGHSARIQLLDVTSAHNTTLSTFPILKTYCSNILQSVDRPKVLEVGARGASSAAMRRFFSPAWQYLGFDIEPDHNVDIVGDAHQLSSVVGQSDVDLVYSSEVMEHLFSPLRFVLEANRVLKTGGLFVARMPTTWPLHAEPWDFWRISVHGWASILNEETGFEILDTYEVGRSSIVPITVSHENAGAKMLAAPAPLLALVFARKTHLVEKDTSGWPQREAIGKYDRF